MTATKANVLITGGAGYIGSVLTKRLLDDGFAVTVVDNFTFRQNSLMDCCRFDMFTVVRGDCRSEDVMRPLLKTSDIVIPLAAMVGAPMCDRDKVAAVSTNVDAIRLICKLASAAQSILYPVTNSGYGIGEKDKYCTEESPLKPISLYGETKVQAEKLLFERGNVITFRLATAFGVSPRMRTDLLVNDFVYRAVSDRAVVVFQGDFMRNYIHVQDIARAFLHGIDHFQKMKNQAYNVGLEDANLSKNQLCALIQKIIPSFVFMEAPIGEDPDKRDYIVSNKKILATGFQPEWSLERGIKELIKAFSILRNNSYANV